ncbi:MAG: DNA internalization-related competence protein ComEC/Rec2 [Chloroflexota bacterium]
MKLILLSIAFIIGVFIDSKLNLTLPLAFIIPISVALAFALRKHKKVTLLVLCLASAGLGILRSGLSQPVFTENHLSFYNDSGELAVRGTIISDPEVSEKTVHILLKVSELKNSDWQKVTGNLLVFAPVYSSYRYGDRIELQGELETPPEFPDFSYRNYLAQQGVYSTMLYPKIEILARGSGFKPLSLIYTSRHRLAETLTQVLPEPQASLAEGIILGMRTSIPEPVAEAFARSGTTHVLAISGVNLSIIAAMLVSLTTWLLGRRHSFHILMTLTIIWLYSILTGFEPPVVRSAVMASLFLLAELLGRQKNSLTALTFAATIMTLVSPRILRDASFQLSFLATAGLILISPPLRESFRALAKNLLARENVTGTVMGIFIDSLSVSLAAVIAVAPLSTYYFGIVSFSGLPATLLSLPVLPVIIVSGLLTGISGLVSLPLAHLLGGFVRLSIDYLLLTVKFFAGVPLSYLKLSGTSGYLIAVYYLGLLLALWRLKRKSTSDETPSTSLSNLNPHLSRKWLVAPAIIAIITVVAAGVAPPSKARLQVSFLDVGQGDAILIQQGSQQILVDGGPESQKLLTEMGLKMPFWDRTIELVILTHPDSDHLTGLLEVLKRYRVKKVLYADTDFSSEIGREWLRVLGEKKIESQLAQAGQRAIIGDMALEILNPMATENGIEDDASVLLRLSKGKISFLLTGDISSEREHELVMARQNLKSTVLKVAHHGSAKSTSREFLAVASPCVAVISVGADNEYGHPAGASLERLEERISPENIYRTDEQGTVEFTTNGDRLWVRPGK